MNKKSRKGRKRSEYLFAFMHVLPSLCSDIQSRHQVAPIFTVPCRERRPRRLSKTNRQRGGGISPPLLGSPCQGSCRRGRLRGSHEFAAVLISLPPSAAARHPPPSSEGGEERLRPRRRIAFCTAHLIHRGQARATSPSRGRHARRRRIRDHCHTPVENAVPHEPTNETRVNSLPAATTSRAAAA